MEQLPLELQRRLETPTGQIGVAQAAPIQPGLHMHCPRVGSHLPLPEQSREFVLGHIFSSHPAPLNPAEQLQYNRLALETCSILVRLRTGGTP